MEGLRPIWYGGFNMFGAIVDMIWWLVGGMACVIAAAVCEGVMDTLQFHYTYSVFWQFSNKQFWDPTISWRNKYRAADPLAGPRFPGSTTIFVGLTDAWHLFKLLRNMFMTLAVFLLLSAFISMSWAILYAVLYRVVYGIIFTISYRNFGE
jgi:hypothetical protein